MLTLDNQSVYIKAYSELLSYLKYLFIRYDNKITNDELKQFLDTSDWAWIEYLKKLNADSEYDKITIITYNYDIWLKRILTTLNIEFNVAGFETRDCKFEIIKSHGSISFVSKTRKKLYAINYDIDSEEIDISNLQLQYTDLISYDKGFLIPPACDSC